MDRRLARQQPSPWLADNGGDEFLLPLEQEMSLDEFDRRLLADVSGERLQQAGGSFNGISLLNRPTFSSRIESRSLIDDLPHIQTDFLAGPSSSTTSSLRHGSLAGDLSPQARRDEVPQTPKDKIIRPAYTLLAHPTTESMLRLPHAPPIVQGIQLVETTRLPDNMRSIFTFPLFNAVQSRCFLNAYGGDNNIVLSAPTGSGKTVIMELAICRLLTSQKSKDFKVVYQAPTRSLCNERYRDWSAKFRSLGLDCAELTGDVEFANLRNTQKAHVIITTPEKWDSVTRKWKDNAKLMQMIRLFLIDEVHMLNETRGATLEAVVSRMKSVGTGVRFIALSATVPNSEDIATWLGLNPDQQYQPAIREVFGEAFRPVTLEKHVMGFQNTANDFVLDNMLVKEVPGVIARHGKRKSVMVFCVTKKAALVQAVKLAELWTSTAQHARLWDSPRSQVNVMNDELKRIVSAGVAFHHSGLDVGDRQAVENGFINGNISVICSTSTLAVGVNLPCYLVILKGTVCYTDNGLQEYSSLEVMQMLGRAGRPQFETSACAVILTSQHKVQQYEKMISGKELLESCLHLNLIEHLNAEIGIGTIHDLASAKRWLSGTFLHVRVRQNPHHYRLKGDNNRQDKDSLLEALCEKNATLLVEAKLVENTRQGLRSTEFGDIMARYYVRYESMKILMALPSRVKMSDILQAIAHADEFKDLRWSVGEKTFFKQINKSNDVRYPIKVDIALPAHKASLVAQIQLGGIILDKDLAKKHAMSLKQDVLMVLSHYNRLTRCVIDILILREDSVAVRNALELGRSLAAGVWDNTPMQLKQISGVGEITARKLASAGINSVDILLNTEPSRIELVMGKSQPYGAELLKKLTSFPNLKVTVRELGRKYRAGKGVDLRIKCELGYVNDRIPAYFNQRPVYVIFLCETSYGKLVEFRRFSIKRLMNGEDISISTLLDCPTTHVSCHVMCDEIAGSHRYAELKLSLSDSMFPVLGCPEAPSLRQPITGPSASSSGTDEFDDAGINDSDLLAAEAGTDDVEVVTEDIDKLLAQGQKRKADSDAMVSSSSNDWREPKKLKNGNWTCQHSCNDDGKVCHHQCCKEGVKKPKKRPRLASQLTIRPENVPMNTSSRQNKSALGGGTAANKSIADILRNASLFKREHTNDERKQTFSSVSEATIGGKTQHSPERSANDPELDDDFSSFAPEVKSPSTQSFWFDERWLSKEADEAELGHEIDSPPDTEIYDICDLGPDECDWNLSTAETNSTSSRTRVNTDTCHDQGPLQPTKTASRAYKLIDGGTDCAAKVGLILHQDKVDAYPEKLSFSEPDCGPHKSAPDLVISVPDVHREHLRNKYFGDAGFWSDLDRAKFDEGQESAGRTEELESVAKATSPDVDIKDTSMRDICETTTVSAYVVTESDEQRRKRLYEEDQKNKWKGLDPMLYEQFGDLVELV